METICNTQSATCYKVKTMEYTHVQKNLTNSPRKLRLVASMVRNMEPAQAIEVLQFTNKAAAMPLSKAIKAALANAGNNPQLAFAKIEINEGLKLPRFLAGTAGRGRGRPYKRRMSHIKVVLTDQPVMKKEQKVKSHKAKVENKEVVNQEVEKKGEKKSA